MLLCKCRGSQLKRKKMDPKKSVCCPSDDVNSASQHTLGMAGDGRKMMQDHRA